MKDSNKRALTFGALRRANNTRQMEWPGNDKADLAFRAIEVAGEFGEVAEAVIALDLLADKMGIDLSEAVARKFNRTSVKYGMQTRLPE